MTYSIVARDAQTGALGVAVQSAMFGVGPIVAWARPGVGAVATQAMADPAYGPRCLDALAHGTTATGALEQALAVDPAAALRQVSVIAADGSLAAVTGQRCVDHAGHIIGNGFVVAANMMASPQVWPAMADAYRAASGTFARRLLAALDAAQQAGGDARGVMSAALLVVDAQPDGGQRRLVDLRIDRSDDPLAELARLLDTSEAYAHHNAAVDALFRGDPAAALTEINAGLALVPGDENLRFVRAGALMASGDVDQGRADLRGLLTERPSWRTVIRGFADKGMLPLPPTVPLDEILG